jgi:D-glycero-D-manno-heptose 1,7-bisphosphate phosphatase
MPVMTMRRAVFLDRDGTLNEDTGYPADFRQIHIYPAAFEAVRLLGRAGFATVVVTHQSGLGRGYFDAADLETLHARFLEAFARRGAPLDALYACPHAPEPPPGRGCDCAKPRPGLGFRAAAELGLDLARSYMVGDKVDDILFGLNIGAVPVLVLTGYGRASGAALAARRLRPACTAEDILEAAAWIVEHGRGSGHGPV